MRRTIRLSSGPTVFDFNDDAGPLANGIGYALGTWLDTGRQRAQIEMEQKDKADALARDDQKRQDGLDERQWQHGMDTQRLTLDRQSQDARMQEQSRQGANDLFNMGLQRSDHAAAAADRKRGLDLEEQRNTDSRNESLRHDTGAAIGKMGDWLTGRGQHEKSDGRLAMARAILASSLADPADKEWAREAVGIPQGPPVVAQAGAPADQAQHPVDQTQHPIEHAPEPSSGTGGFMSLRRSGAHGVNTLGDVTGGRWFGQGEASDQPEVDPAPLQRVQQEFIPDSVQFAQGLPEGDRQPFIAQRTKMLQRWAEAKQSGNKDMAAHIQGLLQEQHDIAARMMAQQGR